MSLIFHDDILWHNPRNVPQGPSATRDTELTWCDIVFSSVQFSRPVVSDMVLIIFILIFKSKIPGHGDFTIISHSSSNIQGVIKQDSALILCWVCYPVFFTEMAMILGIHTLLSGLPRWCSGKESACQSRRCRRCWFNPWVGRIPCNRKWQLLQYSHLENSMDRGAWWATVHGIATSNTQLSTHRKTVAQAVWRELASYIVKVS